MALDAAQRRVVDVGVGGEDLVEVIESMWPFGDPLAVRVRGSTFALRRGEAAAVMVVPANGAR